MMAAIGTPMVQRGSACENSVVIVCFAESPVPAKDTVASVWPELPLAAWSDTYKTLHLWLQIVGKIRLTRSAWVNHSWHVTLYVTAKGLTTSPIVADTRTFQIDFDFIDHRLLIQTSDGRDEAFALEPMSVATFYALLTKQLETLDINLRIHPLPNEVENPIRFDHDQLHCAYDGEYANRFWRALVQADRVFKIFRSSFIGKASPVQLFWGAPDLAVTRFSGRRAPCIQVAFRTCPTGSRARRIRTK